MPIHDWTRVQAGIFHHFHHEWISEIARALNRGLLPPDHYALAEQIAGGLGPDVLTLQRPAENGDATAEPSRGVALAVAQPRVQFRWRAEPDQYAAKAKAVVIRHASNHRVIAVTEIVSPGNKNTRHGLRAFVQKAMELLRGGVHLLVADLFPPGPRDPQGIPKAIWDELDDVEFTLPPEKPLTVGAFVGGAIPDAFVQPMAVGSAVPEMPLFLTPQIYIPVPLEQTYQSAFDAVPSVWRNVLTTS
jgi:hypothetical protein